MPGSSSSGLPRAVALTTLPLVLVGCGGAKLSASATEREIKSYTAYRQVSCVPAHRRHWDYQCTMSPGTGPGSGPDVIGVKVNAHEIVDQEAP